MDQPGTYLPYTDTYLPRVNDIGKKNTLLFEIDRVLA